MDLQGQMMRRARLVSVIAVWCAAAGASAQEPYPNRVVKLVVGSARASAPDLAARIVASRLGEGLGQPVMVENRTGAGGDSAAEHVVRSSADGYTLLLGTVANAVDLAKKQGVDFERELAPVAGIATLPHLLVVSPSLPARSVPELIAMAKAQPGALLFGSAGNGSSEHLSGELFNLTANVKLVHIPYKTRAEALADLRKGGMLVMFAPAPAVMPLVRKGSLKALAATGPKRTGAAPQLPTVWESGLAGFDSSLWSALFVRAGSPPGIIARLAEETARMLGEADVRTRLAAHGMDAMPLAAEELRAYVRQEIEKWTHVVRNSGSRID